MNLISIKHAPQEALVSNLQFQFIHNHDLSTVFSGKIVEGVEVCEVSAPDLSPVPLRLRMHFTDGTFLDIDRKCTSLPRSKRKIMHLNLAWHRRR